MSKEDLEDLNGAQLKFLGQIASGRPIDELVNLKSRRLRCFGRWIRNPRFRKALDDALICAATTAAIRRRQDIPPDAILPLPDVSIGLPLPTSKPDSDHPLPQQPLDPVEKERGDELARLYALGPQPSDEG
jgi:hypothetical protein